ncbi:hypothetical protein BDZ89DRAFT_1141893 [Hymenopellis radicata]|nr:hypothetical protein BDZ89DRAFT_1141893 [Hymenopellis radicata]
MYIVRLRLKLEARTSSSDPKGKGKAREETSVSPKTSTVPYVSSQTSHTPQAVSTPTTDETYDYPGADSSSFVPCAPLLSQQLGQLEVQSGLQTLYPAPFESSFDTPGASSSSQYAFDFGPNDDFGPLTSLPGEGYPTVNSNEGVLESSAGNALHDDDTTAEEFWTHLSSYNFDGVAGPNDPDTPSLDSDSNLTEIVPKLSLEASASLSPTRARRRSLTDRH